MPESETEVVLQQNDDRWSKLTGSNSLRKTYFTGLSVGQGGFFICAAGGWWVVPGKGMTWRMPGPKSEWKADRHSSAASIADQSSKHLDCGKFRLDYSLRVKDHNVCGVVMVRGG